MLEQLSLPLSAWWQLVEVTTQLWFILHGRVGFAVRSARGHHSLPASLPLRGCVCCTLSVGATQGGKHDFIPLFAVGFLAESRNTGVSKGSLMDRTVQLAWFMPETQQIWELLNKTSSCYHHEIQAVATVGMTWPVCMVTSIQMHMMRLAKCWYFISVLHTHTNMGCMLNRRERSSVRLVSAPRTETQPVSEQEVFPEPPQSVRLSCTMIHLCVLSVCFSSLHLPPRSRLPPLFSVLCLGSHDWVFSLSFVSVYLTISFNLTAEDYWGGGADLNQLFLTPKDQCLCRDSAS